MLRFVSFLVVFFWFILSERCNQRYVILELPFQRALYVCRVRGRRSCLIGLSQALWAHLHYIRGRHGQSTAEPFVGFDLDMWFKQRYRIFLFSRKSSPLTHSLNSENFVFFLFPFFRKKKTVLGKVCKPLTRQKNWMSPKKGQKRSKKGKKCSFSHFGRVFFSFKKVCFFLLLLFFFFLEKFTLHSLTHFQRAEKKKSTEKKTHFSLTH